MTIEQQLIDTIEGLIDVIYTLRDGGKEWDEYHAKLTQAQHDIDEAEKVLFWNGLDSTNT
jgi:hypothetical protein